MTFDDVYPFVAKWEGGLDDDSRDSGGITKYGVSFKFLTDLAKRRKKLLDDLGIDTPITKNTIRALNKFQAQALFRAEFWAGDIESLSSTHPRMAFVACDTGINMGNSYAHKLLQQAVGTADDGIWGPKTLGRVSNTPDLVGALAMLEIRRGRYAVLATRKQNHVFLNGWLNRCADLERKIRAI